MNSTYAQNGTYNHMNITYKVQNLEQIPELQEMGAFGNFKIGKAVLPTTTKAVKVPYDVLMDVARGKKMRIEGSVVTITDRKQTSRVVAETRDDGIYLAYGFDQ